LRTPASTDATTTTVTMPMTIPMIARVDRAGCVRRESTARLADSAAAVRHLR
jgi:hypothetical protein